MGETRRFPHLRSVLTVVACAAQLAACAGAAGQCPDGARDFWQAFRTDALSGDPARIAARTRFPFQVRGTLDASGVKKVERADFRALVPKLLDTDPGLSAEPTTMRRLAADTTVPPARACNANGTQLRVGSWVFALTDDGWRFIQAYVDD